MLCGEMRFALQLLGGAASCALFIALARRLKPERELRIYALALVVAALIYLGFAARGTASLAWLALETTGLLVFTLAALAGVKFSAWILATAWAAHAGWDVLLHGLSDAAFVPAWYPPVCAGFDLLLAGYILARFGRDGLRGKP